MTDVLEFYINFVKTAKMYVYLNKENRPFLLKRYVLMYFSKYLPLQPGLNKGQSLQIKKQNY